MSWAFTLLKHMLTHFLVLRALFVVSIQVNFFYICMHKYLNYCVTAAHYTRHTHMLYRPVSKDHTVLHVACKNCKYFHNYMLLYSIAKLAKITILENIPKLLQQLTMEHMLEELYKCPQWLKWFGRDHQRH